MTLMLIAVWVLIFALVLAATKVGFKFVEARQKKQMIDRLHVAAGEPVVEVSNLLREIDVDKPDGLMARIKAFRFARHAQRQIQQAGLSFSASHLLLAMGLLFIPGLGLGAVIGLLGNRAHYGHRRGDSVRVPAIHVRAEETQEAFGHARGTVSRSARFSVAFHAGGPRFHHYPANGG